MNALPARNLKGEFVNNIAVQDAFVEIIPYLLFRLRFVGLNVGTGEVTVNQATTFSKIPKASELRSWAQSEGYEMLSNKNGIETWGIKGTDGWRLKIKQPSTTLGINPDSQKWRFSARSKPGVYLNPVTGETGTRSQFGHLDLDPK